MSESAPILWQVSANITKVLASVPDLNCGIDAQNGAAIGTPEHRYLLLGLVSLLLKNGRELQEVRRLAVRRDSELNMLNTTLLGNFRSYEA